MSVLSLFFRQTARWCALVRVMPASAMQACVSRPLVPSRAVVVSQEERSEIMKRLFSAWNHTRKSPGAAHPVSLSRAHLLGLNAIDYRVALKSDGVRYTLFLYLRHGCRSPAALMIDRARNMYEVQVVAPAEHFEAETVLEGELVWRQPDEKALLFIVFDAVRIAGTVLTGTRFEDRMNAISQCTQFSENLTTVDDTELDAVVEESGCIAITSVEPEIIVRPKRFVSLVHAESVWNTRAEAQHRVDGLVINDINAIYRGGTAEGAIYKWKEVHSIDLLCDNGVLHAADGIVPAEIHGLRVQLRPSRVKIGDNDMCEYYIDLAEAGVLGLLAMRKRPDKCGANSLHVVCATVRDAIENIAPREITAVCAQGAQGAQGAREEPHANNEATGAKEDGIRTRLRKRRR